LTAKPTSFSSRITFGLTSKEKSQFKALSKLLGAMNDETKMECRKLHGEELQNLYCACHIFKKGKGGHVPKHQPMKT
jgi:hypothetical protein